MKEFSIPGLEINFFQHSASQSVTDDAYLLYLKSLRSLKQKLNNTAKNVLDLGSGCGILLLMLAKDFPNLYFTGIDIVNELTLIAIKNFEKLSEYLKTNLVYKFINANYSEWKTQEKFDLILSNPPYFPTGSGNISPIFEKAVSRFELSATQKDLLKCIKDNLSESGKAFVLYPVFRKKEFEDNCVNYCLNIDSYSFTDYENSSFHSDIKKINKKTKIIFELSNA